MVDHILWHITKPIERAGRVQLHRYASAKIDKLAQALDLGSLVVISRTDTFSDDVPVGTTADQRHFLHSHDVVQLLSNLLGPPQSLGVEEMPSTPCVRVSIGLPLCIHM